MPIELIAAMLCILLCFTSINYSLVPLVFGLEGFELEFVERRPFSKLGIFSGFGQEILQDGLAPGQLFSRGGHGSDFVGIVVGRVGSDLGKIGLELACQDLEFFF